MGSRIKLNFTRAMISAALEGKLDNVEYEQLPIFNLSIPTACDGVPSELLNPKNTWADKEQYDEVAVNLANKFTENFKKFEGQTSQEILNAAPTL